MQSLPRPKRRQVPSRKNQSSISLPDLKTYAEDWLIEGRCRNLSPASLRNRKVTTDKFIWFIENEFKEQTVNKQACSAFIDYLQSEPGENKERWGKRVRGGKSEHGGKNQSGTIQTYFLRLQCFLNFCVKEGHITVSPMRNMKAPVHRADDIQPFTIAQVHAMLNAASESIQPKRNRAILLMMFDTGIRAAEVCGLKKSDVSFGVNLTSVSIVGKGNKRRTVHLKNKATEALRKHIAEAKPEEKEALFFAWSETNSRNALTTAGLLQLFKRLGTTAHITNVRCSPHTMRHTYATEFLRNGGDVLALQQFLGHTDIKQTRRYVQFVRADFENQHSKFSPADNMSKK